jgi:hypothetical protein
MDRSFRARARAVAGSGALCIFIIAQSQTKASRISGILPVMSTRLSRPFAVTSVLLLLASTAPAAAPSNNDPAAYRSPYSVQFTYPTKELIDDIFTGERGNPANQSTIAADRWYSPEVREKYGAWGPPAKAFARASRNTSKRRSSGHREAKTALSPSKGTLRSNLSKAALDILIRETALHPAANHVSSTPPLELVDDQIAAPERHR